MNKKEAAPMEVLNRTLQRGLAILELLAETPQGMTLGQIAAHLDLPKSSAFNLLHTLEDAKYLRMTPQGAYQLSLKMFEVGAQAVNQVDVTAVLRQYMGDIHQALDETTHLGVQSGLEVLYIDKLESTQSIRMASRIGARMPLYATAMGKAFLACMTDDEVRALYKGQPLTPLTPNTLTDVEALIRQLHEVRRSGVAMEREENSPDVSCMAVVIRNRQNEPVYALSISAPSFRATPENLQAFSQALLRAQRKIQRVLAAL
ncbi:MAG: IclR family transcriptional regulator [Clostridia bacterium]|nr:IclR family transcriptional regulator [Clostridia bacterium]